MEEILMNVELEMQSKKLKKGLEYANKESIPFVIILGEDEIKNNSFTVKNMINNSSFNVKLTKLDELKKLRKINKI